MMLLCHSLRYLPVGTRKTFVRLVHQEPFMLGLRQYTLFKMFSLEKN